MKRPYQCCLCALSSYLSILYKYMTRQRWVIIYKNSCLCDFCIIQTLLVYFSFLCLTLLMVINRIHEVSLYRIVVNGSSASWWIVEFHGCDTSITSIGECSFSYHVYLLYTLKIICTLSVDEGKTWSYYYCIWLIFNWNIGLEFGNVIVVQTCSNFDW